MSVAATMPIMVTQTVAMFVMMAVGMILYRAKYLTNEGAAQMASIALYVASPAIIIASLATPFDSARLIEGAICMVLTWVFTIGSACIAWLVYRDRQRVAQLGIMISNMGFMGIPLVQMVLGEEYVFYVSACIAAQVPLTFSYGIWLASQDKTQVSPRRVLTNPAVLSVAVGVVLFLCSIELAGVFDVACDGLGNLNTGLAMIVLGSYLAQADLRSILRTRSLYLTHALRLVAVPLLVIACLMPLPLATPVKLTLLIAFAAPSGTVTAIFPQMFGKDYRLGAGIVSSSTLLSLITMPIMLAIGLVVL